MNTSSEMTESVRLHIGNMSKQLVDNLDVLKARMEKFGKITSEFEIKNKETFQDTFFGFVTMELTPKDFQKLLSAFHKVKFMNSNLVIDKARPSFNEIKEKSLNDIIKANEEADKELALKEFKFQALQEKIRREKEDKIKRLHNYSTVIPGAIRKDPRVKDPRKKLNVIDITYRVRFLKFNQKTQKWEQIKKVLKANHKQKLWGYDKHKGPTDLVFKFLNGVWKDGNNHVVEKLKDVEIENAKPLKNEVSKTKSVLDDFLNSYDFDKPQEFDYEQDKKEKLEAIKEKVDYEAETHVMTFSDLEDEGQPVTNDLKTLKSVFNPEKEKGGFTFNLDNSDIEDVMDEDPAEVVPDPVEEVTEEPTVEVADKKALFFPHFDSPFLLAQTQFNKLTPYSENAEIIATWKKEFDNVRVDLMKKFRKRRRDVLRLSR